MTERRKQAVNRVWKIMKKHWTRVWLITALLIMTGIVATYAAYTEVSVVKRVVSTSDSEGDLFSSNCMKQDISSRMLSGRQYSVTVCNYDQEKPLTFSPSQITYTFYAELQVKYGSDYLSVEDYHTRLLADDPTDGETTYQARISKIGHNYSVYKQQDDSGNAVASADAAEHYFDSSNHYRIEFSEDTLAPNDSSTDKYMVTVSAEDLSKTDPYFYVHVWADPTGSLKTIESRIFGASGSGNASSWQGSLRETNCNEVDYDFYNYVITGNGVGTIDILYDDDYFEINQFFFSSISGNSFVQDPAVPEDVTASDPKYSEYNGWKKITLNVDSVDDKSRYELQLYKVKKHTSYTGDEKASKYIACFFTEE